MIGADCRWDDDVDPVVVASCSELSSRLANDDPVRGLWYVEPSGAVSRVWCDASNIATGVALEVNGHVVEDCAWLRPSSDKRHINVAELDAAIKGLSLATKWNLSSVTVCTDSRTVAAWLTQVVSNTSRVKASGLQEVLVRRRVQIFDDIIKTTGIAVNIEWVPSRDNKADILTRVPDEWRKRCHSSSEDVCAAASSTPRGLSMDEIANGQLRDADISAAALAVKHGSELPQSFPEPYHRIRSQLCLRNEVLHRLVKLPIEGHVCVQVIPVSLVPRVLHHVHQLTGHSNWRSMFDLVRSQCYFPGFASRCQMYVADCAVCAAASTRRGPAVNATRPDVPGKPWSEVQLDTLELGLDQSGEFHCVLVCIDTFTKWAEVLPLRHHTASCVAESFVSLCCRWGPPEVVRLDNGTDFGNAIVESVLEVLGVRVRTRAVRHPMSQGGVERFNRTLLNLLRKIMDDETSDWLSALNIALSYHRCRPHSATGLSPSLAMFGWEPSLLVGGSRDSASMSAWTEALLERTARIYDFVESQLSEDDFIEDQARNPYRVGDAVFLMRPERHQKLLSPYEPGWSVADVISPTSVVIESVSGRQRSKVVNVRLLKPQPEPVIQAPAQSVVSDVDGFHSDNSEDDFDFLLDPSADASNPRLCYGLPP